MSSSSIDYHEGYLQCLADLKKISEQDELNYFIKSKSAEHTKKVSDILETMYKIYKES